MDVPSELNGRIQQVVALHMNSVVRAAYAYVKNIQDAQDIAQDTFVAYAHSNKVFDSAEHVKAWLLRVCINKSKNLLKSSWHKGRAPLPDNLAVLPKEESEVLLAVLQLDEKYRMPIHLFYYEGYTIAQIAKALSLPSATVGTRLQRARQQLRQQLGGTYNE